MTRAFTVATDELLISLVKAAKEQLIFVAPGLTTPVAQALVDKLATDRPTVFAITLDINAEVCRLGYGDWEAVELLRTAMAGSMDQISVQPGLRIGLVISDSTTLVFAPTPRLIEAGSSTAESPNALVLPGASPEALIAACGASIDPAEAPKQEIGAREVSEAEIAEAAHSLAAVPPRPFDVARRERVFRYKLEFVELSLEDFKLHTRKVALPAELLGFSEIEQRIRNTFKVFSDDSAFSASTQDPNDSSKTINISEKSIAAELTRLRKLYLIPLGGAYGTVILKRNRAEFEGEVNALRARIVFYAEQVGAQISQQIASACEELVAILTPRLMAKPPESWVMRTVDGNLSAEALKQNIRGAVEQALSKPIDHYVPRLTCIFKAVTYDTIVDDSEFKAAIRRRFTAAEVETLFDEHESAVEAGQALLL